MKKIIAIASLLLTFQNIHAQAAVYGGFSVLNMDAYTARPGLFAGIEFGSPQIKGSIGFNSSMIRFSAPDVSFNVKEIATDNTVNFSVPSKVGYMAIPLMFKYFLLDPEESPSNVVFGMGIAPQIISRKIFYDKVDQSKYEFYSNTNPYNDISRNVDMAFLGSVGYEYTFDTGLAVTGHIGYNLTLESAFNFFDDINTIYNENVLTFGFGTKYFFNY